MCQREGGRAEVCKSACALCENQRGAAKRKRERERHGERRGKRVSERAVEKLRKRGGTGTEGGMDGWGESEHCESHHISPAEGGRERGPLGDTEDVIFKC